MPTWSARTPSATTLRMVWACETGLPSASPLRSPNVSSPKTSGNRTDSGAEVRFSAAWSVMSLSLSSPSVREDRRAGRGWPCADGQVELRTEQHPAEHRTARLQYLAGREAWQPDGVVTDPIDELGHRGNSRWVVACHASRAPVW